MPAYEVGNYVSHAVAMAHRACGYGITPDQQNAVYRAVLRSDANIADRAVVDFAVLHARGAD
ncbi:MAG: hypothetical protein ACREVL_14585 [Solimonas sp.]